MGLEIPEDAESTTNDGETPVRASRRIAQLKIKKEADKSREEEEVLEIGKKHKKDKVGKHDKHGDEKKKRKKKKDESEEDAAMMKVINTYCIKMKKF